MASVPFLRAEIAGEKALLELFKELPKALTDQALKDAGKKALAPVATAARATVRSQSTVSGGLAGNIVVSDKLSKRQRKLHQRRGDVSVYAGPTYPAAAHAHLIEFGTRDRYTRKGVYKGRVKAEPFLRPAWDAHKDTVLKTMRHELWSTLLAAARRLRAKTEKGKFTKASLNQLTKGR